MFNVLKKGNLKAKIPQILIWFFPVWFLADNVLGLNGYQFTIAGKAIRIILFCISVFVLFSYCLAVMIKDKIALFKTSRSNTVIWKLLRPIDYFVLLFIALNAAWATVVPLLVRGEMNFALKDFSTLLVLVLYFPIVFLIRTGRFNPSLLQKLMYGLTILLALWHIVMYIGEVIHPGFYEGYFDFIDIISFGTAVRSSVIHGYGIVRIIQTTSLFLLIGVFISIEYVAQGKWWHILSLAAFSFAICITYTKSIWFGYFIGLFLYIIPRIFINKNAKQRINSLIALGTAIAIVVVLNYAVFKDTVFQRAFNTVRSDQSIEEMQKEKEELEAKGEETSDLENLLKDALGTRQANQLRAQQNIALIEKWMQSKWIGFGYGAYTEDSIRNEEFPYMYESTLPALVMKIGIVGALVWIIFILAVTVVTVKTLWKDQREKIFLWLGIALAYALAVQTNPLLFTFTGMSVLLFLLLYSQKAEGQ